MVEFYRQDSSAETQLFVYRAREKIKKCPMTISFVSDFWSVSASGTPEFCFEPVFSGICFCSGLIHGFCQLTELGLFFWPKLGFYYGTSSVLWSSALLTWFRLDFSCGSSLRDTVAPLLFTPNCEARTHYKVWTNIPFEFNSFLWMEMISEPG